MAARRMPKAIEAETEHAQDATAAFELGDFLPYLLSEAAEAASLAFQGYYRSRYGMLRAEWRVMFHLGRYGPMTATDICRRARLHKTKVSRAVHALEQRRFLTRTTSEADQRRSTLTLTRQGERVFADLRNAACRYQNRLSALFAPHEAETLQHCLRRIAEESALENWSSVPAHSAGVQSASVPSMSKRIGSDRDD